jgi:phosphocarrier protein
MIEKNILLGCSGGLFLRPAGAICETAMQYRCRSELLIGEKVYNLRSVLSVLSAQVSSQGDAMLRCDGTDETDAAAALTILLEEAPADRQGRADSKDSGDSNSWTEKDTNA